MRYREDGEYSIDNNIVERNVRPFTVDRKNTMTFGSEEGIDCVATYHTIIQTCRMMGVKVLKYLQSFFKKFSEGCRSKVLCLKLISNNWTFTYCITGLLP